MNPRRVNGAWQVGWALDLHTTSSQFLGYDQDGHPQFDTTRSRLGELVYQLKYRQQVRAADEIAAVMLDFLAPVPKLLERIDLVVPVPASVRRPVQPVSTIASRLACLLGKPFSETALRKVRETPTLKNISDLEQRREALDQAFEADSTIVRGKGLLLIDDLYRSGATANAVTLALIRAGVARVCFLAATRTRSIV